MHLDKPLHEVFNKWPESTNYKTSRNNLKSSEDVSGVFLNMAASIEGAILQDNRLIPYIFSYFPFSTLPKLFLDG